MNIPTCAAFKSPLSHNHKVNISELEPIVTSLKKRCLVLLLNYVAGDTGGIFDMVGSSLAGPFRKYSGGGTMITNRKGIPMTTLNASAD